MYDISYTKDLREHLKPTDTRAVQVSNALSALKRIEPYTASHSHRVGLIAAKIAQILQLAKEQITKVNAAGMLHDIGKSGVSLSALLKPSSLSDEEYKEIKKHPELGAQLIQSSPTLLELLPGILYHHERFDGTGYPFGLSGEDIPLEARIIAIADTYDAITSDRAYRLARSHREAIHEICRCAGTQFDPKIVDAVLNSEQKLNFCIKDTMFIDKDL